MDDTEKFLQALFTGSETGFVSDEVRITVEIQLEIEHKPDQVRAYFDNHLSGSTIRELGQGQYSINLPYNDWERFIYQLQLNGFTADDHGLAGQLIASKERIAPFNQPIRVPESLFSDLEDLSNTIETFNQKLIFHPPIKVIDGQIHLSSKQLEALGEIWKERDERPDRTPFRSGHAPESHMQRWANRIKRPTNQSPASSPDDTEGSNVVPLFPAKGKSR